MRKYMLAAFAASLLLVQCSKKDTPSTSVNTGLNNKSVGASANDFLSATKYTSVNVQLQYMPGYAPDATALANLVTFLNTYINKPGGINITQTPIAASGKSVFTQADLNALEAAGRSEFTAGSVLSVYVVFVDAPFSTANVLGVAYKNTSLAIFGPTVTSNSGGINQTSRTKLETTVEEHEFGHLLGLVNNGSPMAAAHEDAGHAAHCSNTACLMYYATQTSVMGGILINNPVPMLDANCKADLHANGGK
jgi:hypothetical protein